MPDHERKSIHNKPWLIYVSYEKKGKEILDDYQLSATTRAGGMNKAHDRMIEDGGTNRSIDGIHELTKAFRENEASMLSGGGRGRAEQ